MKAPYHAVSHYDAFGDAPFLSGLPREEEDFRHLGCARAWLRKRGGGRIERYADRGAWLYSHETVAPL